MHDDPSRRTFLISGAAAATLAGANAVAGNALGAVHAWFTAADIDVMCNAILTFYPEVAAHVPVLQTFARRLLEQATPQTENCTYVQAELRKKPAIADEFKAYLVQEFVVHTNYYEFAAGETTDLRILETNASC